MSDIDWYAEALRAMEVANKYKRTTTEALAMAYAQACLDICDKDIEAQLARDIGTLRRETL